MDVNKAFELLGLSPGASQAEIDQAYMDLVRVWHPDRFQGDERLLALSEEKLKELNEARVATTAFTASVDNVQNRYAAERNPNARPRDGQPPPQSPDFGEAAPSTARRKSGPGFWTVMLPILGVIVVGSLVRSISDSLTYRQPPSPQQRSSLPYVIPTPTKEYGSGVSKGSEVRSTPWRPVAARTWRPTHTPEPTPTKTATSKPRSRRALTPMPTQARIILRTHLSPGVLFESDAPQYCKALTEDGLSWRLATRAESGKDATAHGLPIWSSPLSPRARYRTGGRAMCVAEVERNSIAEESSQPR
jgi:hypothetical protein